MVLQFFFKTTVTNCGVSQISLRGTHVTIHQLKKYEILKLCFFIFNFSVNYGCTKIS